MNHFICRTPDYVITFVKRSRNRHDIIVLNRRTGRTITGKKAIYIAATELDSENDWPFFAIPLLDKLDNELQPTLFEGENNNE